jgi:rSAM/selenodomain-associated transferase 2
VRSEEEKQGAPRLSDQAVPWSLVPYGRHPVMGAARHPLESSEAGQPASLTPDSSRLSIIVPTLNEAPGIVAFLEALQPLRGRGAELVLADGGSNDGTVSLVTVLVDRVISSPRGRALQMNAGAAVANGDVLLFLHADCALPDDADRLIADALGNSRRRWGRFDVRLSGAAPLLRVVEWTMNRRSRLTGICTGDQALFVERPLFEAVHGFPAIALMEDVAISRELKRDSAPLCLKAKVTASSRRWEKHGVWRTVVLMWRLRLAYFFGAKPDRLAQIYHGRAE